MNYLVIVKGNRKPIEVSEQEGKELKGYLFDGTTKPSMLIKMGESVCRLSDIKSVLAQGEGSRGIVENDLAFRKNLKQLDNYYKRTASMPIPARAEHEIATRIVNGLSESEKDELATIYGAVYAVVEDYFKDNKDSPICPLPNWIGLVSMITKRAKPSLFFSAVATNDAAVHRWLNKEGEWEMR